MWETIKEVLLSTNAWMVLVAVIFLILVAYTLMRKGLIFISTDKFQFGGDYRERDIIRQQVEWSHSYVRGLYSKIQPLSTDAQYGGYFTKYLLECVYDEIVNWITFNHIKVDSDYISIKQQLVKNLVYSFDVDDVFRTPDFEKQIDEWVEEVIRKLVHIREMYK